MRAILLRLGLAGLSFLLWDGGGAAEPQKKEQPAPRVFYPDAPETPRIQFLATYSSEADLGRKKGGFRRFVTGKEERPEVLQKPYGVVLKAGQLLVCDSERKLVMIMDLRAKTVGFLGHRPPGVLKKPINIAVDSDGTRYIADNGHKRIMVYGSDNSYLRAFGDPEKWSPTDVAIFGKWLYVCDIKAGQVAILDKTSGEELARLSRKGGRQGDLYFPTNLTLDVDGNVFVSDALNSWVLKLDRRGEVLRQYGEVGTGFGQFVRPKGVAVDRSGRLYVVDAAFENVQIFDREGRLLLFFGGPGSNPGNINLPAKVVIDYDNVDLFKDRVAPGLEIEYLILVTSQFGVNKVNVYGFLKDGS